MKIVFMGTADFGIPTLRMLADEKFTLAGVVTTPPRRKGRGLNEEESPVSLYARSSGLEPVLTPDSLSDPGFLESLSSLGADLFVVVAYRILPPEVFEIPPLGTVNVHASLLPKYRGPAPIQRAIENGEKETGITVFQINKGVDTGNIIVQRRISIGDSETSPQLYERLSKLGAGTCTDACMLLDKGTVDYLIQDDVQATRAPKLMKEEALIDWTLPASVLFNKIRAFKPFPGTHTFLEGKRLKIEWATSVEGGSQKEYGTVCSVSSEWFDVQCSDSLLRVLEVKPEGKKQMPVSAFLNGTKIETGMKLG